METTPSPAINEALSVPSLAAGALLSENSRQGFSSKKNNVHPGCSAVNFKTATGIEPRLRPKGIRSRCQSLNRYAYVLNNPTTFTDPSGLDPCKTTSDPSCIGITVSARAPGSGFSFSTLFCAMGFGWCGGAAPLFTYPVTASPINTGGSSGGNATPPAKPPAGQVIAKANRCAAGLANTLSVASVTGLNKVPVVSTLLSNNVSSASQLIFGSTPDQYVPAGGSLVSNKYAGPALIKGGQALGSVEVNPGFQSIFTTVAPTALDQTAVGGVAVRTLQFGGRFLNALTPAQLVYDTGVYLGALVVCSQE